jgi:hypothetical protein
MCFPKRYGVVFFWYIAILVSLPSRDIVWVAIKWAAVTAFWLKENNWVVTFNSTD